MSTIKQVAIKAGVSVATVSRVINKYPGVSTPTKLRVLAAVKELNYTPNYLGKNLRQIKTNKILVLIPSISNQFYSKIIGAMETVTRDNGYEILVCMSHNDPKIENRYIEMLTTKVVDGMIFLSSSLSAKEINLLSLNYPIVQCCEHVPDSLTNFVSINNEKAAYEGVSWFFKNGHKSVAFLGSKVKYSSGVERELGYRKAVMDYGGKVDEELIILEDYSYPGGKRMAKRLLSIKHKIPSAVFCISDSIAIGVISELIENGVNIPQNISVMGFDDTSVAKVYCPPISTISQPQVEMGTMAAQMLIKRVQDETMPIRQEILAHKLVLRDTTMIYSG